MILKTKGEALLSRNTQKRIFWDPNGSRTHDLPDTGFMLQPLSTNPFIICSHLSFQHVEPAVWHDTCLHTQEPSIWPCSPRVSHSSVVGASNRYLEGHGFNSRWGPRKFFSEYLDLRTFLRYLHFIQDTNPFMILITPAIWNAQFLNKGLMRIFTYMILN